MKTKFVSPSRTIRLSWNWSASMPVRLTSLVLELLGLYQLPRSPARTGSPTACTARMLVQPSPKITRLADVETALCVAQYIHGERHLAAHSFI